MPNLVDELLDQASAPSLSVSNLLRKAEVVAVKLRQTETAAWIDAELTGRFDEDVPEYREIAVQTVANFPFQGWQPVLEPTWLVEILNKPRPMPHPIREFEQMAPRSSNC
ncbi:MAG: AbiTii domain-containing protein [Burkholderiales bacterium]